MHSPTQSSSSHALIAVFKYPVNPVLASLANFCPSLTFSLASASTAFPSTSLNWRCTRAASSAMGISASRTVRETERAFQTGTRAAALFCMLGRALT